MWFSNALGPVAAAAIVNKRGISACPSALVIDDFSTWTSYANNLGGATSDDSTMKAINADGGVLTFTPNNTDTSYIYEQFPCQAATTGGYDTLQFNIKGPEAASVSLELQTTTSCGSTQNSDYQSYYYTHNGLSGSMESVSIPLSSFQGANLDAIVGFLWYGFSAGLTGEDTTWQIDNLQLACAAGGGSPTPTSSPVPPTPTSPTSAPAPPSTSVPLPPGIPVPTTTIVTTVTVTSKLPPAATSTITITTWIPDDGSTPPPSPTRSTSNPWQTPGRPTSTTRRTTTRRTTTSRWPPRPTTTTPPWEDPGDDDGEWPPPGWGGWDGAVTPTAVQARAEPQATPNKVSGGACQPVLVDDWASQSRLTFLFYNALLKATSDDGTMKSVVVSNNHVTFTPQNTDSYWYTQFGCLNAKNTFGGISLRINAAAGTTFDVQLSSSKTQCGGEDLTSVVKTSKQLGWAFDGTDQLYTIPFSLYSGLDLSKLDNLYITNLKKAVTFGPVGVYCGDDVVDTSKPGNELRH